MSNASFAAKLPKIELHAHLNGSIRRSTLLELCRAHGAELFGKAEKLLEVSADRRDSRTLSECFDIFALIHAGA